MHLSGFFKRYGQVLVFLSITQLAGHAMALEKPEYKILYQEGKLEYRLYQPYIVAETEVVGEQSYKAASNEGFMRLFRYISGGNIDQASIAMTAPVQRHRVSEEIAMTTPVQRLPTTQGWKVAFMLPSQYALDDVPVPMDPRVVITHAGAFNGCVALLRQMDREKFSEIRGAVARASARARHSGTGGDRVGCLQPPIYATIYAP